MWPVCSHFYSWVMVLSVKKFGSKYCLYGSTKEAGISSGAGEPGHVTSAAVVSACGWLRSTWEHSQTWAKYKKVNRFPWHLSAKSRQKQSNPVLNIYTCICVCVHKYKATCYVALPWKYLRPVDSVAGNSMSGRCWPHSPEAPACMANLQLLNHQWLPESSSARMPLLWGTGTGARLRQVLLGDPNPLVGRKWTSRASEQHLDSSCYLPLSGSWYIWYIS